MTASIDIYDCIALESGAIDEHFIWPGVHAQPDNVWISAVAVLGWLPSSGFEAVSIDHRLHAADASLAQSLVLLCSQEAVSVRE